MVAIAIATVLTVEFSNSRKSKSASTGDSPTQIHIAQGDLDGAAIVVSWVTLKTTSGIVIVNRVGFNETTIFNQIEPASSYTYHYNKQVSYTSPLIHFVNVTGLLPTVQYEYVCGDETGGFSNKKTFMPWGSSQLSSPFTLMLVGDLGQTADSKKTRDQVIASGITYAPIILVGDLSYADSDYYPGIPYISPCNQERWDSWGEMIESMASTSVLMTCPGNHEKEYNGLYPGQEGFQAYQSRFRMPSSASGSNVGNLYYSFNVPFAHVVMLNSYDGPKFNGPYDASTAQYQWLEKDLESVDRERFPWLIVTMHAPWYNSNTAHHDEVEEVSMRESMEALLLEHRVDIVFAGHVHAYERSYAVYNNVTSADAPTYINIGDGGNREGPARDYFTQPSWSAFRQPTFGHGRFTMHNSTHAFWSWHRNLDDTRVVADQVWLVKNAVFGGKSGVRAIAIDGLEPKRFDGYHYGEVL